MCNAPVIRRIPFTAIAALALCGCAASSSSQLDATEVCMRAGFQPHDNDYDECVQFTRQFRAETRRERLRKELDIADHRRSKQGSNSFTTAPFWAVGLKVRRMSRVVIVVIAVGLVSCAGTEAIEHAAAVCMAAGYQQSDADFPACIEDNMRLARTEALHRSLERATPRKCRSEPISKA
jgi:hypothetical protein